VVVGMVVRVRVVGPTNSPASQGEHEKVAAHQRGTPESTFVMGTTGLERPLRPATAAARAAARWPCA
jgi:hypothetical protein